MNRTAVSSATLVSSKRNASVARMDSSTGITGGKRQRVQKSSARTVRPFDGEAGTYTAEKFPDSFSVSHVLNLLVQGEN